MTWRARLASEDPPFRSRTAEVAALALVSTAFLLLRLWTGSLDNYDEALYGQIAREMTQNDRWLTTHWNYERMLDKPPLAIWAIAACMKLLGPTELAVRLPSALAGVGTVLAVYFAASRLFGRPTAALAALVLFSTPHFFTCARSGNTDVPLTFLLTLAIYQFWRAVERPGRVSPYLAFGLCAGLAALTKGAVALLAPGVGGCALLVTGRLRALANPRWLVAAGVFAAVALPWHLIQYARYPDEFYHDYLKHQFLDRLGGTVDASPQEYDYYLGHMLNRARPYIFFAFFLFPLFVVQAVRTRSRAMGFIATWGVAIPLAFTLATTKHDWYIVPVYPALSIALAHAALSLARGRGVGALQLVALLVLAGHMAFTGKTLSLDHTADQKAAGRFLAAHTRPGDAIGLHGVRAPATVFYAGRRCLQFSGVARAREHSQKINPYPLRELFVYLETHPLPRWFACRPELGDAVRNNPDFDAAAYAQFLRLLDERYEKRPEAFAADNGSTREHGPIELYRVRGDNGRP